VVPPTAIAPRLPKDVDAIVVKALAYEPEDRYPDARSFADALVDVLFPTPQSSIQDHLAQQIKQVFAEKIAKQRQARAHDPLIMKVLSNAAELRAQAERGSVATPAPGFASIEAPEPQLQPLHDSQRVARRPPRIRVVERGVRTSTAIAVALVLAAAGAAAAHLGAPWLRPGVVLVTSDPPGLEVTFDGRKTEQVTPAAVEGVVLSRPHVVTLGGPRVKELTLPVPRPGPGALVARVHGRLESALGAITIESVPPGADVVLDDRPAGRTPATLAGVKLDARHRIDLVLPGHEIDQFVVLPEKDGLRFTRRLSRIEPKEKAPK
jgi:hypothetical protein